MPDLTTLANVKAALAITNTGFDAAINLLLPQVTALAQSYTGRTLVAANGVNTKTQADVHGSCELFVEYPIRVLTSVHVSTSIPRVYGAAELLVSGTDYFHDDVRGIIRRVAARFPTDPESVQVVYDLGYATIPPDLERAAIEIISTKLFKGAGNLYHIRSEIRGEGEIRDIWLDDVTSSAARTFDAYKDWRLAA